MHAEASARLVIPLVCACGNKDDTEIPAPPCSADCGRLMTLALERETLQRDVLLWAIWRALLPLPVGSGRDAAMRLIEREIFP